MNILREIAVKLTVEELQFYEESDLIYSQDNSDTSATSTRSTGRAPQMGDDSNTLAWWIVLLTSLLGISGMLLWRKSRQRRGTW